MSPLYTKASGTPMPTAAATPTADPASAMAAAMGEQSKMPTKMITPENETKAK